MAFSIAQTGTASDMGGVPGDCRYVFKTATFTSTYAAGSMTAADLGSMITQMLHWTCMKQVLMEPYSTREILVVLMSQSVF